jgi:hypothetical protein
LASPSASGGAPSTGPTSRESAAILPAAILDPILDDAARRSAVPRGDLRIVRADGATWSDGGLGCPLPGMLYPQVLVEGYWVVVDAAGEELDYRGAASGFRLCEIPSNERRPPLDSTHS